MAAFGNLVAAATTLDLNQYFAFLDQEQFTSLNHDGTVTHTFAEFESGFRAQVSHIEKYNKLEFRNVKVSEITSDVCVLVNEYTAEILLTSGDTIETGGAGTQVWMRRKEGWLLTHISSSVKP